MSEVALKGTAWKVRTEVELDQNTGFLWCNLRLFDETVADGWPEDPYAGFLPPNDGDHSGEGYIRYKVKVREDAPVGMRIDADADIVFDCDEPLTTKPAWFNWIGTGSGVQPEMGCLAWDAVEGATYVVSIWAGDAEAVDGERNVVAVSGALTENRWRLPTTLEGDAVYFWQVTTTVADGTVTESPVWSFDLGGRCMLELRPGWNLLSLPFMPDGDTEHTLLGLNPFGMKGCNVVRPDSLEAGRAYWIYQREDDSRYLYVFPPQMRENVLMPMASGWNMVGPTETDRRLDTGSTVWFWKEGRFRLLEEDAIGGYTLKRGVGYWLHVR